mmetsp:Transcript_33790/g.55104  ORF Transcript_33790/g.55104 Transcript_33790/m.55104 type:complete len:239 (+) Transcript_33790:1028-1744(+)
MAWIMSTRAPRNAMVSRHLRWTSRNARTDDAAINRCVSVPANIIRFAARIKRVASLSWTMATSAWRAAMVSPIHTRNVRVVRAMMMTLAVRCVNVHATMTRCVAMISTMAMRAWRNAMEWTRLPRNNRNVKRCVAMNVIRCVNAPKSCDRGVAMAPIMIMRVWRVAMVCLLRNISVNAVDAMHNRKCVRWRAIRSVAMAWIMPIHVLRSKMAVLSRPLKIRVNVRWVVARTPVNAHES